MLQRIFISMCRSRPCTPHLPISWTGISRTLSTALNQQADSDRVFHFGVVGSGPAGFYTANMLLKKFGEVARVNIIDRLPTPFGLVRSGVAPDHPETKNVINQFTRIGQDERVQFLGNVHVGRDITLQELRSFYSAVVLAYGAESNIRLGIPGEDLKNVLSAREFVWWFNGHPDYATLPIDLSQAERVTIFGLGNVALDCARILLKRPEALAATDIARHALEALRSSAVKRVDIVGRRGPVQAAFTAKELREITKLEGVSIHIPSEQMQLSEADEAELKSSRAKRRIFDILKGSIQTDTLQSSERELYMHFLRTPAEVLPSEADPGRAGAVKLERNALQPKPDGSQRAVGTGEFEIQSADMVLSSIGYRSEPMEGAAFDASRGVVLHRKGRILKGDGQATEQGLYVVGWAKRGPTGIIGTNLVDAEETTQSVVEDADSLPRLPAGAAGSAVLLPALQERGVQVVTFEDWQRINEAEVENGQSAGKSREKFVNINDMLKKSLDIAGSEAEKQSSEAIIQGGS